MARSHATYYNAPHTTIADFLARNARLIAGVGLFVTFWMLVYTFTLYTPQYAAKAVVIIKDSAITGRYIEPDQYYAMQTTSSSSSNPVLNTMGILKSNAISDALWNYFQTQHPEQLKKNKIKTQKDWESFYQDGSAFIKAKNQPGTDLIAIQFSWSDPIVAKEALTVVVSAFQDASRDLNKEEQVSRTKFLNTQVTEIEKQLADIRQQKSEFQSEQHTVSINREGDDLAQSRMELSNKLNQLESQARGKEDMVRRYQQLLGMTPEIALKASAIGQNSSMTRLQDELYRLQQQYALLNSSLTDTNPKVREVQAQIDQVKASIDAEQVRTMGKLLVQNNKGIVADNTRNTLITNMLQAQGEARDLRTQANVVRERLNQINRDISNFPQTAEGLANLAQKENSLSTALDQLRQKVLEGKLKEEQTLSNVFVVDSPRLPEKPQFPTRSHLIVLSLLLGAGVGLASAFAKEQLLVGQPVEMPEWLASIEDDDHDDQHPGGGQATQPPLLAGHGNAPQAQAPQSAQVPVQGFAAQNVPERVELPAVGSLFDSLVPVAGPMRTATTQNTQPDFRHDLTRPIALKTTTQPVAVAQSAPIKSTPNSVGISDADLLPPAVEAAKPVNPMAKSVKAAPPVDAAIRQRLGKPYQPSSLQADVTGVPVMHAAPKAEHQPSQQMAPIAQNAPIERQASQAAYEAQATRMPPPRRRSIPGFLLDEPDAKQPYTLVSKKQLLDANDDLMQEVAPLEAPGKHATIAKSPIPAFMQTRKQKAPRKPLLGNILFGKKPVKYPKVAFGITARAQNNMELPGSLNRLMQTLEPSPATIDS